MGMNHKFHGDPPILLDDEEVGFAAKSSHNTILITSNRTLIVSRAPLRDSRLQYRSIFHRSVETFLVRTAGSTDVDTELQLRTSAASENPIILSTSWPVRERFNRDIDISHVSDLVTKGVLNA